MALDSALPSLFDHMVAWGKRKADRFDVVHDRSKPVIVSNELFQAFMAEMEEVGEAIGYDRRAFEFPEGGFVGGW